MESFSSEQDALRAIMGLADCLGLSVVVDGVETFRQGATAESLGAKRMQGPVYGKPRPALEWLADTTYRGKVNPSKSERTALLPVG
jgi:EAL domain-containing protein (putative c-di-GMP-specific phosphodiesterase class I)